MYEQIKGLPVVSWAKKMLKKVPFLDLANSELLQEMFTGELV